MSDIKLLDCTLRDGGYCNGWKFGQRNILKIIDGLIEANVDIIECGYITNKMTSNNDSTQFSSFAKIKQIIPKQKNRCFVAMVNYGDYNVSDIPSSDDTSLDGIRVAFHKNEWRDALSYCRHIKEKGYKVFIQGMLSLSYSDSEFLRLLNEVNAIEPYAFYIVDSFGMMNGKDLKRLFYMIEHNLAPSICIGFHSHNNMQLSYSNCLSLAEIHTNRKIIIDSSIYGMGRGAGNLNTEIFIQYLNDNQQGNYKLKPLLNIIDEVIDGFYKVSFWGYNLPNYISAKNNAHPNYAVFLDDKKTLTIEDMENIFQKMDEDKKCRFDKAYIEALYINYLDTGRVQKQNRHELEKMLYDNKVVLVAPGKSIETKRDVIRDFSGDAVIISVNFLYPDAKFIFLSNLRRYRELEKSIYSKCIVTSNIPNDKVYMQTNYRELLNNVDFVKDNAGLMAIKFLMGFGVREIALAGFDGYSHDTENNYVDKHLEVVSKNNVLDAMNEGMSRVLSAYSDNVKITFITAPRYVHIKDKK